MTPLDNLSLAACRPWGNSPLSAYDCAAGQRFTRRLGETGRSHRLGRPKGALPRVEPALGTMYKLRTPTEYRKARAEPAE
jgi:hypothetical protein